MRPSFNLSNGALIALKYILHHNPATKANICNHMKIGPASIIKYINELSDYGLIAEKGVDVSSGGRKPILYEIKTKSTFIFCIDISTIYCEVAIIDLAINIYQMSSFSISVNDEPSEVINKINRLFFEMRQNLNLNLDDFLCVGVSVFGAIKNEDGVLFPPLIKHMNEKWINYPIIKAIKEQIPLQVFVQKGINASAQLEYNYGSGKDIDSMLYIRCGMSIRSVLVLNGKINNILPYADDAFGHMVINYNGLHCQCGQYGCLNCYATIPAIIEDFKERIKKGEKSCIQKPLTSISILDIIEATKNQDSIAINSVTDKARMLGIALANYINLTNPAKVILAGLLVEKSELYYKIAVETAKERLNIIYGVNTIFQRMGKFEHSLTLGAGMAALDECISSST